MPHIVAGPLGKLPSDIRYGLGAFRHRVFIQRLGWALPDTGENDTSEWDQFDRRETVHIVALEPGPSVCGCARLMPTTGPYLLRDLFPGLAGSREPPQSPLIWELSRFAASRSAGSQADSARGMRLFPYALALAASLGATSVIGVVTHSAARLYRQSGLELRNFAPADETHAQPFLACTIDLTPTTFARLQCDQSTLLDSMTWFGPRPACATPCGPASRPDTATGP